MKDKKTFEFKTGFFELRIFWNGPLMSLQFTILIGLIALAIFSDSESVKSLVKIILMLDIVAMLFYMFSGGKSTDAEGVVEHKDVVEGEPGSENVEDVKVDIEHKGKKDKKKDTRTVKDTEGEIKKKVPIPNPGYKPRHVTDNEGFATAEEKEEVLEPTVDLNGDGDKSQFKNDWEDFF